MRKFCLLLTIATLFIFFSGLRRQDRRDSIDIPVLMYHNIVKDPHRHGTYCISPDALAKDLRYLHDNGYTTIVIRDLLNYVQKGYKLPDNPVMLTFDDGHYNNVYYAEPLLKEYDMRAVIFINGEFCEKSALENAVDPNYSYVLWGEISDMHERGIWDIQSHSWGFHSNGKRRGATRKRGETLDAYNTVVAEDCQKISDAIKTTTGCKPLAFAYPYGFADCESEAALRENGIEVTFQSYQGTANFRRGDETSLSLVKRHLRSNQKCAEDLLKS